jgi:hypothetical protein
MAIEFILGIMQFFDPILQDKANILKTALSNVARDLEKEPETPSNKLDKKGIENVKNQLTAETLIRKKIRSLIKEQVRSIFKEDIDVETLTPADVLPAIDKNNKLFFVQFKNNKYIAVSKPGRQLKDSDDEQNICKYAAQDAKGLFESFQSLHEVEEDVRVITTCAVDTGKIDPNKQK